MIKDFNERLWYQSPAKEWDSQALHLGNGYFGASFFGGVARERFSLGEKTFWLGGPGDATENSYGIIPGGKDHIKEIRRLILNGCISEADELYSKTMQGDRAQFGNFSTIGDIYLNFKGHETDVSNYIRELDLSMATASVSYDIAGTHFHREYFCSYPARALIMRITCDKPNGLSFDVGVEPAHKKRTPILKLTPNIGLYELDGYIDDNNRPYRVKISVLPEGGAIKTIGQNMDERLEIQGANAVTIIFTVATDYLELPPLYRGADPEIITSQILQKLKDRNYASIRDEHVADYQKLYHKTQFHLEDNLHEREVLPTNERWKFYANHDYADLGFKELVFNFGKYLLISASRKGALPSGLQGPWSCHYKAPWGGNYQININIPLIYMPSNVLGLAECNLPFLEWIKASVIPGSEVAKAYYGTSGWVSHATGNIWGNVAPGNEIEWGAFPSGAAWECRHLWEQFEFNQDLNYLKEIYEVMKGAAQFWLQNLTEWQGKLVAIPAVSAEQKSSKGFLLPPMQDVILIRDLFDNVSKASKILGVDSEFCDQLIQTQSRLMPLKIGRLGQLQEWVDDVDDPKCHHRHFMHLMAVHPCQQINPLKDKALTEAAKVSMNLRGDGENAMRLDPNYTSIQCSCLHNGAPTDAYIGGNWSRSWKCWIWARLLDGNRADKIASELIGEAGMENLCTYQQMPKGRTPMQLDGSATTPGFMAEMLMQSHQGEIHLLPALPNAWARGGKISGLRARGGFIIDIVWAHGKVTEFHIRAIKHSVINVHVNGEVRAMEPEIIG